MDTIDWASRGIIWVTEEVSERAGPNGSDTRSLGKAWIPVVSDLGMFTAAYGEGVVLGSLDGTSIRVMAQDVNRSGLRKGLTKEQIQDRIDGRLKGVRARGVPAVTVVTKTVYALPDGTVYEGTNEAEYQAAYMAALVDAGLDASAARALATVQHLAK